MMNELLSLEIYKYPLMFTIEYPLFVVTYFIIAGVAAFMINDSNVFIVRLISRLIYLPLFYIAFFCSPVLRLLLALLVCTSVFGSANYIGLNFYIISFIVITLFVKNIEDSRGEAY